MTKDALSFELADADQTKPRQDIKALSCSPQCA
eukprot:CAMPEP_0177659204 /NCGR_PEP_ID=MMETSP0447-20121125/17311_1 /TAXON_ID=0 /ORGANISM="Stygamoeba regulata, Strain BSH-02190019" /LENGTH=32 /DNA_ID= /DNA_START= /DNA_END= /DNA_ORIENTATION=